MRHPPTRDHIPYLRTSSPTLLGGLLLFWLFVALVPRAMTTCPRVMDKGTLRQAAPRSASTCPPYAAAALCGGAMQDGATVLHFAAEMGLLEMAQALLAAGADKEAKGKVGCASMRACMCSTHVACHRGAVRVQGVPAPLSLCS